jgi:SSS family solute:Na+ symporter
MLSTLPDLLIGVVIVLVLSASMSTLSSLVLTSASTLTVDFLKETFLKGMDDKKQLRCVRILILFFIGVSVMIALDPPTFIAQLMGISWGALAGAFLAPFLYGLYWKGVTKAACTVNFLFSTIVMLANIFVRSSFPKLFQSPINAGAACMLIGLIIVPVVSLFTAKPDKDVVDGSFACYEEKVLVPQSSALGEEKEA